MMGEWKTERLVDFISHKKGLAFKSSSYTEEGSLVIRVSDTTDSSIDISNCKKIPQDLAQQYNEYALEKNDIVIMTVGSWPDNPKSVVGKVIQVPAFASGALLNQNAVRIRKKDGLDQIFLYYRVKDTSFSNYIVSNAQGSANQASITLDDIFSFPLILPPLPEQKAIASVLSSLDDKIDLLHRQNKTLEAMAEILFRQWFVEEAGEDWENGNLLEIIDLVGGGTPKTSILEYWDGNIPWLSGGDIASNHKSFTHDTPKHITEHGLKNSAAKLLPKHATVISARGTVGKFCMLAQPMAFSQSNYGILPKNSESYYFTYLLINHVVEELQSSAYGSVFDTITTTTFKEHEVSLPPRDEIIQFDNSVSGFFEKMLLNKLQIRTLEKLRDTLLPKLMSGEVRVEL